MAKRFYKTLKILTSQMPTTTYHRDSTLSKDTVRWKRGPAHCCFSLICSSSLPHGNITTLIPASVFRKADVTWRALPWHRSFLAIRCGHFPSPTHPKLNRNQDWGGWWELKVFSCTRWFITNKDGSESSKFQNLFINASYSWKMMYIGLSLYSVVTQRKVLSPFVRLPRPLWGWLPYSQRMMLGLRGFLYTVISYR